MSLTCMDRRFAALENLLHDVARTPGEKARVDTEASTQRARPENFQHLPKQMIDMHVEEEEIASKLETMRILGLVGMGGLGKTTLAKAVFNTMGSKFDDSCFLSEAKLVKGRENDLKEELWKWLHFQGRKVEGNCNLSVLRGKRLLLVLDDVSYLYHKVLQDLAEDTDTASRFILTSHECDLLKDLGELRPGIGNSGRLGLGAPVDSNKVTQYDDVYTSYRKQRSTNYHTSLSARATAAR
ncbi:unnamed protein product [Calypogeia fissa]